MDLNPAIKSPKRRHGGFIYPDSAKKTWAPLKKVSPQKSTEKIS
jgi:hypothetical protein